MPDVLERLVGQRMTFDDDEVLVEAPVVDKQMPGQLAVPLVEPEPGPGGEPQPQVEVQALDWRRHKPINWDRARRMYVEGERRHDEADGGSWTHWPSLSEVGRMLGIRGDVIRGRAAEEDWVGAQKEWRARVDGLRQEARAKTLAQHASKMDADAAKASVTGINLVLMRIEEIADAQIRKRERREQVAAGMLAAELDDPFEATIDGRELETLARAAGAWHTLGRKVLGFDDPVRVELSGAVDVRHSVNAELLRDDPDRLFGFLVAAERSGLLGPEILDGETVEDAYPEIEASG